MSRRRYRCRRSCHGALGRRQACVSGRTRPPTGPAAHSPECCG
jgi:hypothetical protein